MIRELTTLMGKAHVDWHSAVPRSAGIGTEALKRRIWEKGFDHTGVYPTANRLEAGAEDLAAERLAARGASFLRSGEHSTLREFHYDVAWVEFAAEYRDDFVPPFKRLVLALESEFGDERAVLFDFHKLLCARAELRVMVWDADRFLNGHAELERRIELAAGADEGYWLLSGWGTKGFTHVAYDGTSRLN